MGIIMKAIKRSYSGDTRKEDHFLCNKRDYQEDLSPDMNTILREVDSFLGFAPFIPEDVHATLTVYLDKAKIEETEVTLKEIKRELEELEKEKHEIDKRINRNNTDKDDYAKMEDLSARINKLNELIDECKSDGKDSIPLKRELLGYYTRCGKSGGREIVLLMDSIGNNPYLAARVYIHELMHAFFDDHNSPKTHRPCAEEPLAEYGMLCFMEMFTRIHDKYKSDLFDSAKDEIKAKKKEMGICHYGYGLYLFEDKENFCVDWISLYHNACNTGAMTSDAMKKYLTMISPIKYPHHEKASAICLEKALRSNQFCFTATAGRGKRYYQINGSGSYTNREIIAEFIKFKLDNGVPFSTICDEVKNVKGVGNMFISSYADGVSHKGDGPYTFEYKGTNYYISTQLRDNDPKHNFRIFREFVSKKEKDFKITEISK